MDDVYYLLGDANRLYRKMEIGPVVNTPTNSPINAAPTINPEFDWHSVEYIKHIHVPDARLLGCIIINDKWSFSE